jgi:hypothetical protein
MPPAPKKADAKKRSRLVNYLAFVETQQGVWLRSGPRGASSVYALRRQLLEELRAYVSDTTNIVIVPLAQAHVVQHEHVVTERDTFTAAKLDYADLAAWLQQQADDAQAAALAHLPVADVPGYVVPDLPDDPGPDDDPIVNDVTPASGPPPADPDAEDERDFAGNPDLDPATGVSRRAADQATAADEGVTIFPPDTDI